MPSRPPRPISPSSKNEITESAPPSGEFLTAADTAQAKGVTVSAVYKAIAQNRLPYQKVLGRVALLAADVAAWIPAPYVGRPPGIPVSEETKAKISEAQKKRWQSRQGEERPKAGKANARKPSH